MLCSIVTFTRLCCLFAVCAADGRAGWLPEHLHSFEGQPLVTWLLRAQSRAVGAAMCACSQNGGGGGGLSSGASLLIFVACGPHSFTFASLHLSRAFPSQASLEARASASAAPSAAEPRRCGVQDLRWVLAACI